MLAFAVPSAASAMQGDAAATAGSARVAAPATAHQAAAVDTRVAIILQRKPAKKSGK
jgi:hypothetical protein